ncbi:hypothetical protein A6V39_00180 [Candidatus Mycoplasma haematobovis]|uniref:Uncharacterized protein n=1 Tax=Candidatus Mycoplasma haematobovis TaxID=432608 RepID=A0A1A9QET9_9MOLU|nr:hypothetical protein [Candidatus Mycoplasma haematobovis]OAL10466.1 hypothetical protein A6V39_00180 [Candidatus Mycoplasma haematobovis]
MTSKSLLLTVAGVSTLGGVAAGAVALFNKKEPSNVKELLINKEKTPLDVVGNTNDKQWKLLANKYKGNNSPIQITGEKSINKIAGLTIQDPRAGAEVDFAVLKSKCKSLFDTKINNDESFNTVVDNAENWCTLESPVLEQAQKTIPAKPSNMKEFIKGKNWEPLDKSDNSNDKTVWEALISKYSTVSEPTQKITIDGFKSGNENKVANIKALQTACDKLLDSTTDLESNAEIVKNWCTKQTTLNN